MNNNSQGCTDENCPTCSMISDLTQEFGEMISDNVAWDKALEYVLRSALATDDLEMESLIKDVYSDAFSDGVLFGIEQSQASLNTLYESIEESIEEEYDDEIEFDEEVVKEVTADDIQAIIKNSKK